MLFNLGEYEKANGGQGKVPTYISSNVESNRRRYVDKSQVRQSACNAEKKPFGKLSHTKVNKKI
jgi:hypothetical protein